MFRKGDTCVEIYYDVLIDSNLIDKDYHIIRVEESSYDYIMV